MRFLLPFLLIASLICQVQAQPAASARVADDDYQIAERDLVQISVYDEPDLAAVQRVDASGRVRVPLLGNVEIGGLSIREAEKALEAAYQEQRYLKEPQVSITISDYAPREISIFGQVKTPGRISLPAEANKIDIVEAISRAGGFTGIAKSGSVRVTRADRSGKERSFNVDVDSIIRGSSSEPFYVYAEDTIFVPERLF